MNRQIKLLIMLAFLTTLIACSGSKTPPANTETPVQDTTGTSETFTGEKITVAVLDFENNTSGEQREAFESLSRGLTDMFITELSKVQNFKIIERTRLDAIANELALADLAGLDPETAQQVGRMLGAQVLYYGSYGLWPGEQLYLHGRLVRVETAHIIVAEEEHEKYNPEKIFNFIGQIAKKLDKEIQQKHDILLADVYYAKGLMAEDDEDDVEKAISLYKKAVQYDPNHEQSLKAIERLENEL